MFQRGPFRRSVLPCLRPWAECSDEDTMEYAKQTVCLKLQKILFGPFSRELTRQRLQNCDLERRMLTGTVEGDEDKILEQDHQALVSENQLLGEDNQQLRQDNYALEEQIDELRCHFFLEKGWHKHVHLP